MDNISKVYTESVKKHLGYHAIWPIQMKYELGDYGELVNGEFKRRGNIKDKYNIDIEPLISLSKNDIKFSDDIKLNTNVEGDINQAKVKLTFEKSKGVYLHFEGCTHIGIKNYHDVGEKILKLNNKLKWKESFIIITELVKAKSSMIIVSNRKNATMELNAQIDEGLKSFNFRPSMNFNICNSSGTALEVNGAKDLTPLMKLSKVISNEFSEHDLNEYKGKFRNGMNKVILYLKSPLSNNRGEIGHRNHSYNIAGAITRIGVQTNEMKLLDNRYMNKFIDVNSNKIIIPRYFVLEDGNTVVLGKSGREKITESINRNISNGYKINRKISNNKKMSNGYKVNVFKEI